MVLLDLGEALEQGALVRIVEMRLERDHALGLQQLDEQEHQAQQVAIVVLVPVRARHHSSGVGQRPLHHVGLVGDQEGASGSAADHHQLKRQCLHDDAELAAGQDIAAKHHANDQDNTNDRKHQQPRATRPTAGLAERR